VDAHHGQVDVVEQLVVELDRHAGGEEHHHLQGDNHQARRNFSQSRKIQRKMRTPYFSFLLFDLHITNNK
jgi:hypothetical protein